MPPESDELGWSLGEWAAAILALDPPGSGGVYLRGPSGPETDAWLELARRLAEPAGWTALSPSVDVEHLTGAIDLEATLARGSVQRREGILERSAGSVLEVRWPAFLSLDAAHTLVRAREQVGIVAFQPGMPDDDTDVWAGLTDPLAIWLVLPARWRVEADPDAMLEAVRRARASDATVRMPKSLLTDAVRIVTELGVHDERTLTYVARIARQVAALRGADAPTERDVGLAMALVVLPRTGALPAAAPESSEAESPPPDAQPPGDRQPEEQARDGRDPTPEAADESPPPSSPAEPGAERLVDAAEAWLPANVLSSLRAKGGVLRAGRGSARNRARRPSGGGTGRGRTLRARRGRPGRGRRLHFLETVRAAAPHQGDRAEGDPIRVRSEHLRIRVIEKKEPSTVVFAVDASGSQAVARLGEVKGAVELLLGDSYRRRDHVALVVFRGDGAELVLPPTRSLTRVRRAIGGLPGGGGTPLAHGLLVAARTAESEERMGRRPTLVLLTDGRPNVPMGEGRSGKEHAREDALATARAVGARGWPTLMIDSSRRANPFSRELATALDARLIRLTSRDPATLRDAVRSVTSE